MTLPFKIKTTQNVTPYIFLVILYLKEMSDPTDDKPGLRALEAMKSLNKTVSIFKIPKVPQKKTSKMKILTEERYIEVSYTVTQTTIIREIHKTKTKHRASDSKRISNLLNIFYEGTWQDHTKGLFSGLRKT